MNNGRKNITDKLVLGLRVVCNNVDQNLIADQCNICTRNM